MTTESFERATSAYPVLAEYPPDRAVTLAAALDAYDDDERAKRLETLHKHAAARREGRLPGHLRDMPPYDAPESLPDAAWIPDPLDGAELLDDVRAAVTTYVAMPSREHTDAVTLWIAATHCVTAFDYATRLVIRSAEKRSGKSRLLEVIDATCHRPLRAVNATVPAIFRSLDADDPPTLLLDEADTIFGSKKVAENNEDLRGLLNAGYQRGLPVLRTVGPLHTPTEFTTFAMAALAGIGHMPDTIEDRGLVVPMRRRKPTETVKPFRLRRDRPQLLDLAARLAEWSANVLTDLSEADPALPVEDRAADTWAPLVAVADAAGGQWPERARIAATVLTMAAEDTDTAGSLNVRLLADIRDVFTSSGGERFYKSATLCERLRHVDESPWRDFDLNPSKLGRRLREYGIKTAHNTARTERGYRLEDFTDPFERYLPGTPPPSNPVQGVQQAADLPQRPDAFSNLDAFKASSTAKASSQNGRSDPVLDGMDTFGRGIGSRFGLTQLPGRCRLCGFHIETQGHDVDCDEGKAS